MPAPVPVPFVRTPEERFADLLDWPYPAHSVEVDGLRMSYVDEGPQSGRCLLLLHGEPTWGYLYRRMVPPLVAAGNRTVVPDLIGFGRSDKPLDRSAYTYAGHVAWLRTFVATLDLRDIILVVQDWGGLLGLRVAVAEQDRIDRLVITNTVLPEGGTLGDAFMDWRAYSQRAPFLDCGALLQRATLRRRLTEAEVAGYRAPFPDERHMAAARQFPLLAPLGPDDPSAAENREAWQVLERWERPVLTLWAPDDIIFGHHQQEFIERIPGARGQPHQAFAGAGHFVPDDCGEDLAVAVVTWLDH